MKTICSKRQKSEVKCDKNWKNIEAIQLLVDAFDSEGLIMAGVLVGSEWSNGGRVGLRGDTGWWSIEPPAFVDMRTRRDRYDFVLASDPAHIRRDHSF